MEYGLLLPSNVTVDPEVVYGVELGVKVGVVDGVELDVKDGAVMMCSAMRCKHLEQRMV